MCLTAPGRVLEIDGPTAVVDLDGRRRTAMTLLEPDVAVGDWVIVAGGAILRRLDATDALEIASANRLARQPTEPAQNHQPPRTEGARDG